MNPETLKALQESIVHWEENLNKVKRGDKLLLLDIHGEKCALCVRFSRGVHSNTFSCGLQHPDHSTEYCPITLATGESACQNTPWEKISEEIRNGCGDIKKIILPLVKKQLTFLKSILP
jgi:hypothetical protein